MEIIERRNDGFVEISGFAEMVNRDARYCDNRSVPVLPVLLRLLQTVFSVSCLLEEGRSLSFRICSFDVKDCPPSISGFGTKFFIFQNPVLFNTSNLKKLALSANPDRTMICVSSLTVDGKEDLYITAIVFFLSNYEDLSLGNAISGYIFPNILNLFVTGPGRIIACSGNTSLRTYESGRIVSSRKNLFDLPMFTNLINKSQDKINTDVQDGSITTAPIFKNYLKTLISYIRSNNHGGSLVIVPDGFDYSKTLNIKYRLSNSDVHQFLVKESKIISSNAERQLVNPEILSSILYEIKQYVSTIADFASVDGALVINYSGAVIGYGAEILLNSPAKLNVFLISPDNEEKKGSITEYGTRHRSAFRLVKNNADVICFIFSQDGGIKACFNDNGKVSVYTNIENELEIVHAKEDFLTVQ